MPEDSNTSIYLVLCKGKTFLDSIISRFEWFSKYTHVAYSLNTPLHSDPEIIESFFHYGIHKCRYSETHKNVPYDMFTMELTQSQKNSIEKYLYSQIGKKYNYLGLLDFPFKTRFFGRLGRKLGYASFCSELIFDAFQAAKINLWNYKRGDEVSPAMISQSPILKKWKW